MIKNKIIKITFSLNAAFPRSKCEAVISKKEKNDIAAKTQTRQVSFSKKKKKNMLVFKNCLQ